MKIAIIPARGGSKRIPRKNIREFMGSPMITWSIRAAQRAQIFEHIIVSTDDQEIAEIARSEGAETPFFRPQSLADDHTPTAPVIAHAIEEAEAIWGTVKVACCIYATAPFIQTDDLHASFKRLSDTRADYAFPVTSYPFPIQRAVRLTDDDRMSMFAPEHFLTRSQDLEEAYHDAGQFYWGWRNSWFGGNEIIGPNAAPLIIPRHRVQDIDTPEDWVRAEMLFATLRGEGEI